jgi:hypothetical protein
MGTPIRILFRRRRWEYLFFQSEWVNYTPYLTLRSV